MRPGEWYSVGDVAWMDTDGFYYICDRKRDMIISAGMSIHPAEIEDVLHRCPDVQDVEAFGMPDEDGASAFTPPCSPDRASTPPRRQSSPSRDSTSPATRFPREVSFHEDFPRDAADKLLKRVLREPRWAGRAARI